MAFITNLTVAGGNTGVYNENGTPSGIDNNDGNIRHAGTIADTALFSTNALGEGNPVITILSGQGPHVEGALSLGAFNGTNNVILGVNSTIAGAANTILQGGSDSANLALSPNSVDTIRTFYYKTSIRAGDWNEVNGSFDTDPIVDESGGYNINTAIDNGPSLRASGTDVAATTTQDSPGRITFHSGSGGAPTNQAYARKYNW